VEQCLEKAIAPEEYYALIEVSLKVIRVRQHLSEECVYFRFQQRTIRRYGRWSEATVKQLA
jgi:hypothetical protein